MNKSDIKKMKNLIATTQSGLSWEVNKIPTSDFHHYAIFSDPQSKIHNIHVPIKQYPSESNDLMAYLHELCHATLAETVNPQFASTFFHPETDADLILAITPQFQVAKEWFVDAHLNKICPNLFRKEIQVDLSNILEALKHNKPENFAFSNRYIVGLLFAEASKWLHAPIATDGIYSRIIDALLDVDPNNPTLSALEFLTNKLLALETNLQLNAVYFDTHKTELFTIQI